MANLFGSFSVVVSVAQIENDNPDSSYDASSILGFKDSGNRRNCASHPKWFTFWNFIWLKAIFEFTTKLGTDFHIGYHLFGYDLPIDQVGKPRSSGFHSLYSRVKRHALDISFDAYL